MRRSAVVALALVARSILASSLVSASLIDFEADPAALTPVDNAALSTPYGIAGGGTVRFFFDANANNSYDLGTDADGLFEAYGPDSAEGFANGVTGIPDTANGGLASQLGSFFLRQAVPGVIPDPFIIDYNTSQTIAALSGEIWDIDGQSQATEQWLVEVLDVSNSLITSQLSPLGNSTALDGLPWLFSFSSLPSGVDKLRLTFVGTKTSGVGLAFNNFTPIVPEPASIALLASGAVAIAILARRRRSRSLSVSKSDDAVCYAGCHC